MSHSDLDALDNFLDKKKEEEEIKWDIEELKNAYIKGAEEYDRLMGKNNE